MPQDSPTIPRVALAAGAHGALIGVTTFLCEGCRRRFPAHRLHGRGKQIDLRHGIVANTNHRLYAMTCSVACAQRVGTKTLEQWETWARTQYGDTVTQ